MPNVTQSETPSATDIKPIPLDRVLLVDLRSATPEQMAALTSEAIKLKKPLTQLLGDIIVQTSNAILGESQTAA